ncbi:MAG: 2-C-methyl-D-erythritol 2,4-cyclodiphosphate synthase [Firmicutes bacterium]|jgi:2-C-methyl-D-erythritol 2,4-cyclodiphosphate synthase|nr:2-C-methyl-D-erythritol 2,4-cyclodiphosphate synthase [Bacillota bacterium]
MYDVDTRLCPLASGVVAVIVRTAIGQDSHRFESSTARKPLVLGGVIIPDHVGLRANSDGDVVLHALANAISGITGIPVLGEIADQMCLEKGITNSEEYVRRAISDLGPNQRISHVSFSIECVTPRLSNYLTAMRDSISRLLGIETTDVGITATSGEGLTDCGRGEGISVYCVVTVIEV